jgi:hypothetical protein
MRGRRRPHLTFDGRRQNLAAHPRPGRLMIACTDGERAPELPLAPQAVKIPPVVPVPTKIAARAAGNVAPKVANIWRPISRTKPAMGPATSTPNTLQDPVCPA